MFSGLESTSDSTTPTTMSLLRPEDEEITDGIEVAWEDQQRINQFSKYNTRLVDIEDQLKVKREEKEYLDELNMELELADEDEPVLYKLGDAFLSLPLSKAQSLLETQTQSLDESIESLEAKAQEAKTAMDELKVLLYAKFGKGQINLEVN